MNTDVIRLDAPKYYTRATELRSEQDYGIGRTTLVRSWKIITPNVKGKLQINGVTMDMPELDGKYFNIPFIRSTIRDLIPSTKEENDLYIAESTIFGAQLTSTEFYKYFPTSYLFDFLFTGGICTMFKLEHEIEGESVPDIVKIEEEFVLTEGQISERLSRGETLEDIDVNNKSDGQSVQLGF